MGIAKSAYRLLLRAKKEGCLKGVSLLQLGKQDILFDQQTLYEYAKSDGVPLEPTIPYGHGKRLDDRDLFGALGFREVHSLDFSNFEGADIVWDLNMPVPEEYWERFDVIYDGGTAEHVFHFPQVLKNIHLMLKSGGVVIHHSPSHNHVDHGFYMFSPQVFFEYYSINDYEIVTSEFFEYSPIYHHPWTIYHYEPGVLDQLSGGGFGNQMIGIHLVARKTERSTCDRTPQQGRYSRAWSAPPQAPPQRKKRMAPLKRLGVSLKKKVTRRYPVRFQNYLLRRQLLKKGKL